MNKRSRPITAAELMREVPPFVVPEEEPLPDEWALVKSLREMGFAVDHVSDLRHGRWGYRSAVPLLIEALPSVADHRVKEEIVRTLSVKLAKPVAGPAMVKVFKESDRHGLRWAAANGLELVADKSLFDEIAALAVDQRYGKSREMLALALGNIGGEPAREVLLKLLDDEVMTGHAIMGLRKIGDPRSRSAIEQFANHPKTWVRNEVKKALAKFDRSAASSRPGS
jgi:HEAT repeat protein